MHTYKEGYQAGWSAYLADCKVVDDAVEQLQTEAQHLAEKAGQALPPQQQSDYWLGYYHGRTAAKTCLTKQIWH